MGHSKCNTHNDEIGMGWRWVGMGDGGPGGAGGGGGGGAWPMAVQFHYSTSPRYLRSFDLLYCSESHIPSKLHFAV